MKWPEYYPTILEFVIPIAGPIKYFKRTEEYLKSDNFIGDELLGITLMRISTVSAQLAFGIPPLIKGLEFLVN